MTRMFTKENFARLTHDERSRLMYIQMSRRSGGRSAYLPDDCSECDACGEPTLGSGLCSRCYGDYKRLTDKMMGVAR